MDGRAKYRWYSQNKRVVRGLCGTPRGSSESTGIELNLTEPVGNLGRKSFTGELAATQRPEFGETCSPSTVKRDVLGPREANRGASTSPFTRTAGSLAAAPLAGRRPWTQTAG